MSSSGIVHVWELPQHSVGLKLPDDLQSSMVENALGLSRNGAQGLAEIVGFKEATINDFRRSRFETTTLSFITRLCDFLEDKGHEEFSMRNLERKIERIKSKWVGKSILSPKFPMDFNSEAGARVVAGILFDGGITSAGYPFYSNNEESLIQRMIRSVEEVVGAIECNTRLTTTQSKTVVLDFPKILGEILVSGLGMVPGHKVLENPPIPEFILSAQRHVKRAFLRQAFDDDGSVGLGSRRGSGRSINLFQYHSKREPPTRLLQLKELIEGFDVPVNGPYGPTATHRAKRGYTSYGWVVQISNQRDIRAFAERIGFSLPRKTRALEELLNSYVLPPRFKKGAIEEEILKICKEMKRNDQKITIERVGRELGRGEAWVAEVMRKMVKRDKLRVAKSKGAAKTYRGGFTRKQFDLVNGQGEAA